ncbi:MAG: hypothetical protein JEZ11_05075 [Desulfobacterales bacterium]|nr:hypothetical protein [Desulfobacterales bacterium]
MEKQSMNLSDADIDEIVFLMTAREKVIFANMDEKDLPYVQDAFGHWLEGKVTDDKAASDAIYRIWKKLGYTHRIRRVK